MSSAPLARDVERRKLVKLRLRSDLKREPQKYEGRTFYVVKDPVSLRYYRFKEAENFLLDHMDGEHTLEEAQKAYERRYRPERLTLEDLEGFARQLLTAGLAVNDSPQAGKQLYERKQKRVRSEWMQTITNILYIKIPVFDPDRLLAGMMPWLWWIFTPLFLLVSVAVMLTAVLLVATHFDTFMEKLPAYHEFFSFKTAVYLWVALGVVKIIHEFGHGLSCKAFGGEVHEMGALLLVFSPALYCNVSDAWTMPDKWKRIIISAAGIYVELIIAAFATFVWWNSSSHPFVNNLALCLMVVCSVSTVVFNANPLMRYDGYYVLADWLEIPNLRDRANKYLSNLVQEHCLGIELPPEPYMALWRRVLFVTYAVVSYVYRWVVTYFILYFLYSFLKPYKLGVVSSLLAVGALASMIGWPIYRLGKSVHQRGRIPDMKPVRVAICVIAVLAVVAAAFTVEMPISRVRSTALIQVQPESIEKVFVQSPGVLDSIEVKNGQKVQKGEVLARFSNLTLDRDLDEKRTERKIREDKLQVLRVEESQQKDPQELQKILSTIEEVKGELGQFASQVEVLERQKDQLVVTAPREGVVMSLPEVDELGRQWDKEQERPLCSIGDASRLRAVLPVSPAEYRLLADDLIHAGDLPVTIRVQGRSNETWQGNVSQLPESEAREVPPSLTNRAGGPVVIKPSGGQPGHFVPQNQCYLVAVNFLEPDPAICPGTMAQVKIHCKWRTFAWWLYWTVSSTFDLGLM